MERTVYSNCKINLGLNILERLPNGYHSLDMIMVPIDLMDKMVINFLEEPGELSIKTNKPDIPTDKNNILYKIYQKFYEVSGIVPERIEVYLEKNIPHEAGLGGGSSNGAFFLKELNSYHNHPLTASQMIEVGKSIGADIPFFIVNRSARVKGIGEKIEIIENRLKDKIILIKPNFGVSTAKAYKNYSLLLDKKDSDIDRVKQGMEDANRELVDLNIENILEQGLLLEDEKIKNFREELKKIDGIRFHMSGSGSAYYTIVSQEESKKTYEALKENLGGCEVYLCSFL